ncbi:uracil-DNA glycosylase family protein [Marinobacterium marinum]|uniref:Uracil-DNA glycosylase-like domain-containing protein n=1 Tax=Marinobacterium marinum TaxID=2756129 RepID=A0A7W1WZ00_9GAMM|nr:hypothetical protein [Marinobacterium marinum]MBA4502833.1 hypothetical protein [Marinobacterium marinum]
MSVELQEQQRHQWLDAIGIDSWLPRQSLPGAAPSPAWVAGFTYPEVEPSWQAEAPVEVSEMPAMAGTRSGGKRIDTAALLAQPSASAGRPPETGVSEITRPATQAVAAARRVATARPEPAPRFKLAYLVRGDLLIIDSLPPHQAEGFSRRHRRLLQGMTNALGMATTAELSTPFMLPWPMLAGKNLDQGPEEARRAVARKLNNTLAFKPEICRVLLLGEAACHWVTDQAEGFDALQGQVLTLNERCQALVTLSLSELLSLPERKAEAWRDLQPFRRTPRPHHD